MLSVHLVLVMAGISVGMGSDLKPPSVFISVMVRNKEHALPYFLSSLYKQSYPKNRIILYLRSDHNQDRSIQVLQAWLSDVKPAREYHDIITHLDEACKEQSCLLEGEIDPVSWTEERFEHIMQLRQEALEIARFSLADYFFSLDCDVFLTDTSALQNLVDRDLEVVAPMLTTTGMYSNFWAGMSDTFYYQRTEQYRQILDRKEVGCFSVPMVHTATLISLRHLSSDKLAYLPERIDDYPGPRDDIIVLALSARLSDIPLHVCNDLHYGVLTTPLEEGQSLADNIHILRDTLLEATVKSEPVIPSLIFSRFLSPLTSPADLDLDKVFMINLERRDDRAKRMKYNLDMLGISYDWIPAVDGSKLNSNYLEKMGVKMLPEFSEPYHGRAMTFGEIGCFLSHYQIWQDMITQNSELVLVLEDDIKFEPFFVSKLQHLIKELKSLEGDWDLVFLGRKILHNSDEPWLEGSSQLVRVDYTYWTLAYLLTKTGAKKLLEGDPLGKMVPVDEYLPIMYDRHPNKTWSSNFPQRDLKALSVAPLLVYPTHYTGDQGYISDTEWTKVIQQKEEKEGLEKDEL